MTLPFRGVWGGADECGLTRDSVARYMDSLAATGFNQVFLNIKQGHGRLCWPSDVFPDAVHPDYRNFDLPQIAIEEGHKHGIAVHAWMIDFMEGEDGYAFTQHPEWAMRNALGQPTNHETLRGRRFDAVWMCPAQRPGYTDQYLVPLYAELAERYNFASLHHDYIRYPGDLAPDQYCFCDACLENLPRWAGFINECNPDEPYFHEMYDRPYLEAHWEQSPRVLPANWDAMARQFRAKFLLEGSFFTGGRPDLDAFFYAYRAHWITQFARESAMAARGSRPDQRMSGAYFKNPIHSGRFIGQDWRTFAPWSDLCIPMDYRDHFPGTMEDYLILLSETIDRQKKWCQPAGAASFERQDLWVGFAIWPLYRESPQGPHDADRVRQTLECIASSGVDGVVLFCSGDLDRYAVRETVRQFFVSGY